MWTRFLVLASRIRSLVSGRRLDAEFDEELHTHLSLLVDEQTRRGVPPDEALRRARIRLGGVAQLAEDRREHRSLSRLESTIQDARYALRILRKNPAFSLVAVLTLAIGIGANTAMFSVVHAVLLRPLPYQEPDRLVRVFETNPLKRWTRNVVAPANYADWRRMNSVFSDMAAYYGDDEKGASQYDLFLSGTGEPERLKAIAVSGNLFRLLGAAPLLGRTFTDEETFEGKARVAILSFGLWQRLFAGDPSAIGRTFSLSGQQYDVVGVMPPDFFMPGRDVQVWIPLGFKPDIFVKMRRPHWLTVVARLSPGVTMMQARRNMEEVARQLEKIYPDTNTKMGVRLEGFHESLAYDARTPLLMLLGAVACLFVIVCVNVANLQLGRAAGRVRELTIRQALGASRKRLIQQLVTEGAVLSIAGGAIGILLAVAARRALARYSPDALPIFADVRVDRAVLLFDVALSMLAPIVFGLIPALSSSRAETLNDRSDAGARRTRSVRDLLVASEVALSVVLVVGAGLLVRSLIGLQQVDPGFVADRAVAFNVQFPSARYPDDARTLRAIEEVERRVRTVPGISAVGATTTLPLHGYLWTGDATVEGRSAADYERELRHESVTPDYFRAMGIRLLKGRYLDDHDRPPLAPVTVVNQALATQYFRGEDPVGRRLKFGRPADKDPWVTVVGVVADYKQDGLDARVQPEVYVSMAQQTQNGVSYVLRVAGDPAAAIAGARATIRTIDKALAVTDVTTMDAVVHASLGDQRFRTTLLTGFAGVALLLAALGIYGVLAYFVTQRTREIGVRLALGAPPARVLTMILRQGLVPVAAGGLAGLAGAYALTNLIRTLLFGVAPTDPATYAATSLLLGSIAVVAAVIPATRAMRVDPLVALREE